jgi:hypothetical protein
MCSSLDHVYRLLKTRSLKLLGDILKVAQDAVVNHPHLPKTSGVGVLSPRAQDLYASSNILLICIFRQEMIYAKAEPAR